MFCLVLFSCNTKHSEINRSFYYWQSNFHLSEQEKQMVKELNVKSLFIKYFDVTWDKNSGLPVPQASLIFSDNIPEGINLVPVVFITNETLELIYKSSDEATNTLAFKIAKKIIDINLKNNIPTPKSIQLDCDWTETTKETYFKLIETLKTYPAFEDVLWSATIRLHQIKYKEKMGVPPVDRGALMFYNTGNIEDLDTDNSIYNNKTANQYSAYIDIYPLPLDAAIACFSWGLLFDEEKLLKIFYPLYPEDLPDSLFVANDENIFTAKKNFYFEGQFVVEGNTIKLETMSAENALEAAQNASKHLKNENRSVILYHLDAHIINHYTNENFQAIYSCFE